jgi:hypothetical protein
MSFPTGTVISVSNLNSGTADPSLARADILAAVQALNAIIASANQASGTVVLTGSGKLPSSTIPSQITLASGVQVINPQSGVVNIRDILRLQPVTVAELGDLENEAGDVAYCEDGADGEPTLAFYNGTDWVRVSVGAAISAE